MTQPSLELQPQPSSVDLMRAQRYAAVTTQLIARQAQLYATPDLARQWVEALEAQRVSNER